VVFLKFLQVLTSRLQATPFSFPHTSAAADFKAAKAAKAAVEAQANQ
jgi:hypothetical protein